MSRGFKKDLTVTRNLYEARFFVHRDSFVSLDGHLVLRGADITVVRLRVERRDRGRCRLKLAGCTKIGTEMDHRQGGLVGRCDCPHNLQMACNSCHTLKHRQIISASQDWRKLYGETT